VGTRRGGWQLLPLGQGQGLPLQTTRLRTPGHRRYRWKQRLYLTWIGIVASGLKIAVDLQARHWRAAAPVLANRKQSATMDPSQIQPLIAASC
jgi:hypothetical protein